MKKYLILLLTIVLFSCENKKEAADTQEEEIVADSIVVENDVPVYNPESKLYVWRATADYKKIKNDIAPAAILTTDSLIKGLNEYYENVYLEKTKQGGDTLYTIIKDANYLTQQMGSTGAEMYLADVVLNLTAVPGIQYVRIDMTEGDHMQPGTWSKESFKNYKEVIQ